MKIKAYILTFSTLTLLAMPVLANRQSKPAKYDEYQVKAAFLYNFAKLTDWPKEKLAESNGTVSVGIIGKSPFGKKLDFIKGQPAKNKKIAVKYFESFKKLKKTKHKENLENLRKCHLLFICSSEKDNIEEILGFVEKSNLLTVGDIPGFLEAGGMINLITEGEKVSFEINVDAAGKAGLKLSSKLIRVAKKVVRKEAESKENSESS